MIMSSRLCKSLHTPKKVIDFTGSDALLLTLAPSRAAAAVRQRWRPFYGGGTLISSNPG